ncbi:MAG: hypothetical protein R2771_09940 [Saprospiraceae bacterium]
MVRGDVWREIYGYSTRKSRGYEENNLLNYAQNLKGKLLLILWFSGSYSSTSTLNDDVEKINWGQKNS